jgi:hypothetical protein
MTKPAKPQIILTLEPIPHEIPVAIRLRQLLKTALRRDRLRCVRIDGDGLDEPHDQLPNAEDRHA